MNFDLVLLGIAALLGLSVVASKAAGKLGIPTLLVFIVVGMLAGSDGPGGIWFTDAEMAQQVGILALAFILFSGGMDTEWPELKSYVPHALLLATLGVVVTALVVGICAVWALGFGVLEGLLLGAVIASTDAAAVFTTLRSRGLRLRARLRGILELESGSNDPAAIFMTITLVTLMMGEASSTFDVLHRFIWQMVIGGAGGYAAGRLGVIAMRRLNLDIDALYHVVSIVIVLIAYAGIQVIGGNGFLAVYVAGITFGQGDFAQRKGLRRFHDGVAWLMQIAMFLVLGLLVFPSQLPGIAASGLLIALTLIFVARPLGVLASLSPLRVPFREQTFIAWTGLRGAVPIILATYPLLAEVERAQEIFNIVFFVVLLSALLQGTTLPWLARRLKVEESAPA